MKIKLLTLILVCIQLMGKTQMGSENAYRFHFSCKSYAENFSEESSYSRIVSVYINSISFNYLSFLDTVITIKNGKKDIVYKAYGYEFFEYYDHLFPLLNRILRWNSSVVYNQQGYHYFPLFSAGGKSITGSTRLRGGTFSRYTKYDKSVDSAFAGKYTVVYNEVHFDSLKNVKTVLKWFTENKYMNSDSIDVEKYYYHLKWVKEIGLIGYDEYYDGKLIRSSELTAITDLQTKEKIKVKDYPKDSKKLEILKNALEE